MRRVVCSIVLGLLAVVIGLGMLPGKAEAVTACYSWSIASGQRWVLSIKSHSRLVLGQRPYSVVGKLVGVCGTGTIATFTGTIITNAETTNPPKGSHLGLSVQSVAGASGTETCFPIVIDCTSSETNPTPATWTCQSRSEAPLYQGASSLVSVSLSDSLCNVFE